MEQLSPKKECHATIAKFSDRRPTKTIFVKNPFFIIKIGQKLVNLTLKWLKMVNLTL